MPRPPPLTREDGARLTAPERERFDAVMTALEEARRALAQFEQGVPGRLHAKFAVEQLEGAARAVAGKQLRVVPGRQ